MQTRGIVESENGKLEVRQMKESGLYYVRNADLVPKKRLTFVNDLTTAMSVFSFYVVQSEKENN